MKIIAFTKMMRQADADELARIAHATKVEGFDLCVREGYPVNPDNADTELPKMVSRLKSENIPVPMVTGEGVWRDAADPSSTRILSGMAQADVGLYKLGYYYYRPGVDGDYWAFVDRVRRGLKDWSKLAERFGVKVCYHTHCDIPGLALGQYMGTNCAALMHLLKDLDPARVGAYVGTGNLVVSGEPFDYGIEMVGKYLSIVELQDVYLERIADGDQGMHRRHWTTAGRGAGAWTKVFETLVRHGFHGPLTMHAEFEVPAGESFEKLLERDMAYFSSRRSRALRPDHKN
ncbi:MAG: sugar phosphate isomerase/epimerase [Phycisphaerales bacterium]|nr:sugar phosphate isomerase/epimerase [Phycisphaerales bacterium]